MNGIRLAMLLALLPPAAGQAADAGHRVVPDPETRLTVPPLREDRPRLMFTPDSLREWRNRVKSGEEPSASAAALLVAEAEEALPKLRASPETGRNSNAFYHAAIWDGEAARLQTHAWLLTGNERHGRAALDMILAWAEAEPRPASNFDPAIRFPSTGMEVARAAIPFLESYDLLASGFPIQAREALAAEAWFRSLVEPIQEGRRRWKENDHFNRQEFQNHHTAHTMGLAAIGYVLGDRGLVQFALDHPDNERDFKTLIAGMIFMPGQAPHHREPDFAPAPKRGEIHDRYRHFTAPRRGLQYAHLSFSQLVYTAEMAWNNGFDFYQYRGPGGEKLLYPFQFYADFFRLRDASLRGGFYVMDRRGLLPGEKGYDESMDESPRFNEWETAVFEVGNLRYPGTPEITALLRSKDRAAVPRHPHNYFFHPALTHGAPAGPP